MGNSIIHFKVEHPPAKSNLNISMVRDTFEYTRLVQEIEQHLPCATNETREIEYENKHNSWSVLNDTHTRSITRFAQGAGTEASPIRLRLLVTTAPVAADKKVYFVIADKEVGDTRFSLDHEAVTLEALVAEATARYGQGARIMWAFEERWVRLDYAKDVDYMQKYATRRAKDGNMLAVQLKVFYNATTAIKVGA